jgi:hypothetical protein
MTMLILSQQQAKHHRMNSILNHGSMIQKYFQIYIKNFLLNHHLNQHQQQQKKTAMNHHIMIQTCCLNRCNQA